MLVRSLVSLRPLWPDHVAIEAAMEMGLGYVCWTLTHAIWSRCYRAAMEISMGSICWILTHGSNEIVHHHLPQISYTPNVIGRISLKIENSHQPYRPFIQYCHMVKVDVDSLTCIALFIVPQRESRDAGKLIDVANNYKMNVTMSIL